MFKSLLIGSLLMMTAGLQFASAEGTVGASSNTKFNGFLQFYGVNDTQANPLFNMKARKAELKFSGSVVENTRWLVMADAAKALPIAPTSTTDNKILQELIWGWSFYDGFELVVGQFKMPNAGQALESNNDILFAERAMSVRAFADYREPAAMVTYKYEKMKLSVSASNGQGNNVNDNTNSKDLTGRLDYKVNDDFKVGAWGMMGDYHKYGTKGRLGIDARYTMNEWDFRADVINDHNGGYDRRGIDVDVGYMLNEKWQPVARYDAIDGNGPNSRVYSLGLNYLVGKNATKIGAAFSKLKDASGNGGVPVSTSGNSGNLFLLSFQTNI